MSDCARSYNDGYNDGFKAGQQWAAHETYVPNILAARENEIRSHGERAASDAWKLLHGREINVDRATSVCAEADQVDTPAHTENMIAAYLDGGAMDVADRSQPSTDAPIERLQSLDRLDSMPVTRWQEPAGRPDAEPHIVRSIN